MTKQVSLGHNVIGAIVAGRMVAGIPHVADERNVYGGTAWASWRSSRSSFPMERLK